LVAIGKEDLLEHGSKHGIVIVIGFGRRYEMQSKAIRTSHMILSS